MLDESAGVARAVATDRTWSTSGAQRRYRPDDVEAWLDRVTDDRAVG